MRTLIDYFINRPLIVNLVTLMVFVVGAFSIWSVQKETFPSVDFDVITISTSYPGSSSEDVEKLVTISIERKLKEVDGIKTLNGLSAEGTSIVYLEVEPDAEIDKVLEDVKNAVDSVDDLPDDVKPSRIRSRNNKQRGVLKVALTGVSQNQLRGYAKSIRDDLERINGIALVELDGYRVDEIRIEANPDLMNSFEVTIGEVYSAVKQRNLNLSAGKIESSKGDLILRTVSEFQSLEDIENVVVRSNSSGYRVKVKDVAKIIRQPTEGSILQRSNGEEAIFLDIKIKENADIIRTTKKVKAGVENFFEKNDTGTLKFKYADDASYYVKRRLNILTSNGAMGIILVFICLLFFLNFRISVMTSLGAPLAFMVSFILMDTIGLSLNLISMFALILVLGMLVDDSIIVAEYYYQKLEKGMKPKDAAKAAAFDTIAPVTATILTTMVAFGSLFFMGGIMGKFLWPVPAVVIICLTASLIECFFILPSHLAEYCRLTEKDKKVRWYHKLTERYGSLLTKAMKHPGKIVLFFFLFWIGSGFVAKNMKFELFPGDDVRTVFLQIKGKVGIPLKETTAAMKKLEVMTLNDVREDELDQIKAQIGVLRGAHGRKRGTHYGSLIVYLTPPGERERSTDEIVNELTRKAKLLIPEYIITLKKMQGGPPRGKPVDVELSANSLDDLKLASKRIWKILNTTKGIKAPEIDFEEGKEQVVVKVNDNEARRLGLSTQRIAIELRRAFSGDEVTEIRESDEDIEIKLFLDEESRSKVESLNKLYILNNQGRRIPLKNVVTLDSVPGAFVIRRLERKRVISISGNIDKKITNSLEVAKKLTPAISKIVKDYDGMTFNFGGENKDTQESVVRLAKSGFIALSAIFIILVVMFGSLMHPIVVMAAIPLGLIGVILTFFITGQSLGFMALMGVIGLVGVVVNDSIVLVTFINQTRRETNLPLVEAVIVASKNRFRPVILTTFTTVVGLMPIAHPIVSRILSFGVNKDSDPFLQPMAMGFAWGLLFASLVTLIFVPANYIFFERVKFWIKKKLKLKASDSESSEKATTAGA